MEKANVIKALETCAKANHDLISCDKCPYNNAGCEDAMLKDAISLLKASEPAKPKYSCAVIFTKRTNLSAYCNAKLYEKCVSDTQFETMRKYYARERDVQLILLTRYKKGKLMCRIKCPVNPIPVKGEFEAPSFSVIQTFLLSNGWNFKQKIYPDMFE